MRHSRLSALLVMVVVTAGACGDDDVAPAGSEDPGTTATDPEPGEPPDEVPTDTAVGNPRTVEVCGLVDVEALAAFGEPSLDGHSSPTTCLVDFSRPGGEPVFATVAVAEPGVHEAPDGSQPETRTIADLEFERYEDESGCTGVVRAEGVEVGIGLDDTSRQVLACTPVITLGEQIAETIAAGDVAHRQYGEGTLTERMACEAIAPEDLATASVPDVDGLEERSRDFGNTCELRNDSSLYLLSFALTDAPLTADAVTRPVELEGHQLFASQVTDNHCTVRSQQLALPDGGGFETVDVIVGSRSSGSPSEPESTGTNWCAAGMVAIAAMLDHLGLQ